MQRAVAVAGIEPSPVRCNPGWTGGGVVYALTLRVDHDPPKWIIYAGSSHEFQVASVDDIDTLGRAVPQIVLRAVGIDTAAVERHQLTAGDRNGGQAFGLG